VGAMLETGIDEDHQTCGLCENAAAQLYASGWLEVQGQALALCGQTGKQARKARRKAIKRAKKEARGQLISVGVIPPSIWWWLASWLFRAFLDRLLKRWADGEFIADSAPTSTNEQ